MAAKENTGIGRNSGGSAQLTVSTAILRAIDEYVPKVANGQITPQDGRELVADQARSIYDSEHGDEIAREAMEVQQQETRCAEIDEERKSVRSQRMGTPEWERASTKSGKRDHDETAQVPFEDWSFENRGKFVLCLTLSMVMLAAGAANIQGNLVASGLPLFTLNPVFAWLFAMLAPAAALAIHAFGEVFRTWRSRNRYRAGIFVLTAVSVAAWSWLFADLFHGTGSGLDLSFEEDGFSDTLFVWLQIITEINVGASLFLIAEHIAGHYSPNWWVRNREYVELLDREASLDTALEKAQARLNTLRGQQNARLAQREAVIGRALAEYLQRLNRFGDL